jgi:hypothetical protein
MELPLETRYEIYDYHADCYHLVISQTTAGNLVLKIKLCGEVWQRHDSLLSVSQAIRDDFLQYLYSRQYELPVDLHINTTSLRPRAAFFPSGLTDNLQRLNLFLDYNLSVAFTNQPTIDGLLYGFRDWSKKLSIDGTDNGVFQALPALEELHVEFPHASVNRTPPASWPAYDRHFAWGLLQNICGNSTDRRFSVTLRYKHEVWIETPEGVEAVQPQNTQGLILADKVSDYSSCILTSSC